MIISDIEKLFLEINGNFATDYMIDEAENKLGVIFPKLYKDIIKIQNGGNLNIKCMEGFCINGECNLFFHNLLGVGEMGIDSMIDDKYLNLYLIENWGFPLGSIVLFKNNHGGCSILKDGSMLWIHKDKNYESKRIEISFDQLINIMIANG
jgi:hypothetical protein